MTSHQRSIDLRDDGPPQSTTINERVADAFQRWGDRTLFTLILSDESTVSITYHQFAISVSCWRRVFQDRKLHTGSRIVVALRHSIDLYAAYLGAVLDGYVPAMFAGPSPKQPANKYAQEVSLLIRSSDAQLLVCDTNTADDFNRFASGAIQVCTPKENKGVADGGQDILLPWVADPDAVAFLQYSSGTTGLKKGVAITHRALLWQIDQYARAIELGSTDVIVSWLPLYHDMGLIACYWLPILTGTPVVVMSPFDWVRRPEKLFQAITRHGGTLCWQPNFAYNHLVRSVSDSVVPKLDLHSMRGFINCSEPIMGSSHLAFTDRFGVCGMTPKMLWSCYGMAECTFAVTSGRPAEVGDTSEVELFEHAGASKRQDGGWVSSGCPLPDTEVKIIDQKGTLLTDQSIGQIVIQSPCLMKGYCAEAEDAQAMKDGWFHTGDMGFMVQGQLFVTGRCSDLIILAGRNIYPHDIEAVVNNVTGVIPGRCVALGHQDERLGTQQLIVIAESHQTDPSELDAIVRTIGDEIVTQMNLVADEIQMVEHKWLEKSTSGKMARSANLEKYIAQLEVPRRVGDASNSSNVQQRVERIILSVCNRTESESKEPFSFDGLIDNGNLDSLGLVRLVMSLEKEFGIVLSGPILADLAAFNNLEAILSRVQQALRGSNEQRPSCVAMHPDEQSVRDRKCNDFLAGPKHFDLLILGSSRVQSLSFNVAAANGYKSFNFSVNSARAEDWYCIHQFVVQHNDIPLKRVILGIDIEALTVGTGMDHRLVNCPRLCAFLHESDQQGAADERAQIHHVDSATSRFNELQQQLRSRLPDEIRRYGYDAITGDIVYVDDDEVSQRHNARRSMRIQDVHSYDLEYKMRLAGFDRLNPKRLDYFIRLVKNCLAQNVQITCFLTPLHPSLHKYVSAETDYRVRIREFMDGLRHNQTSLFQLLDFSTPVQFGGIDQDFINAAHIGGANADLLLGRLLGDIKKCSSVG